MRSRRQIWLVLLWDRNMKMVWSWEEQGGDSHSTREVWGWLRSRALVSDAQSFQFRPQSHEVTPRREIWEGSQISWQSVRKAISVVKPPSRREEEDGARRAGTKVCLGFAPRWRTFCPDVGIPLLFWSLWLFGTASPCHRCGSSMASSVVHLFITIWRLTQHVSKVWSELEWSFFIFILLEE